MDSVIIRDPDIMHGTPVFRGRRVPVQTLFEYLEGGELWRIFQRVWSAELPDHPTVKFTGIGRSGLDKSSPEPRIEK
jgi:hypothetical protein